MPVSWGPWQLIVVLGSAIGLAVTVAHSFLLKLQGRYPEARGFLIDNIWIPPIAAILAYVILNPSVLARVLGVDPGLFSFEHALSLVSSLEEQAHAWFDGLAKAYLAVEAAITAVGAAGLATGGLGAVVSFLGIEGIKRFLVQYALSTILTGLNSASELYGSIILSANTRKPPDLRLRTGLVEELATLFEKEGMRALELREEGVSRAYPVSSDIGEPAAV